MAGGADGSELDDSRGAGAPAARQLADALRELAAGRQDEAGELMALADELARGAAPASAEPMVGRFDELADLPPPDWVSRVVGVPLAKAVAAVLATAPFRKLARHADPLRLISRLRMVVERAPIRHSDRYPRRAGDFITWRSKYGARKHELRVPLSRAGDAGWRELRSGALIHEPARLRMGLLTAQTLPQPLLIGFEAVVLSGTSVADELLDLAVDVLLVRLQDLPGDRTRATRLSDVLAAGEQARVRTVVWVDLRQVELDSCRNLLAPRTLIVLTDSAPSREALIGLGIEAHFIAGLDFSVGTAEPSEPVAPDPVVALRRLRQEAASRAVALRRLAACTGLPNVGTGAQLVSTICVSHRIERVEACVATFRRQTYPHKEFIFVANTDRLSDEWLDRFAALGSDLVLLRTDSAISLGESLNRARSVARGELWTKLDDDDHYGPAYLADQVEALVRSGATVVGKGTYFTYVEGDDAVYLASHAAENAFSDRFVHGGTILADRRAVEEIEFLPVRRGTDSLFLQQCKLLGHRIYSSDRFNFVYMRYQAEGHHTYDVANSELRREHVFVRKGLDLGLVDI